MVDIFHHLKYPKFALKNIHRVLCDNGRVIMVEPAMGLIPRFIYKIFHHEPNGFDFKIEWDEKPEKIPGKKDYFAAQSIPWRAFIKKELKLDELFEIKKIQCFSDFSFLASGGYSYISFYPKILFNTIRYFDRFLTILSKNIFSARMLVVLEKK